MFLLVHLEKVLLLKMIQTTKFIKCIKANAVLLSVLVALFVTGISSSLRAQELNQSYNNGLFYFDKIEGLVADEKEIRAGLLYDLTRNTIVWEKDMDYAYPIASLTKMMVGLLAVEDIEAGNVCWDDKITVSRVYRKKVSRRRYTSVTSKEEYSLEDLLKMAMVGSHNESTAWIAKHCSGSLETFVARMNTRAQELGMTKTQYSNPSGLPAVIDELDNSSSPRDMLVLGLEVLKHDKLMAITSIPYATVSTGKGTATYRNHNGLVINYNKEVDGIKTGFTKAAGFCLVSTATRGGHRMMSVVFGVRSPWIRNGLVASMMNSYYDAMKLGRLGDAEPDMTQACAFLDSVNGGLVCVRPNIEPKHQDSAEESFAYTYKTVNEKVKKTYTVRSGDNLGKIAERYDVTTSDLKKWNRIKGSTIQKGQHLAIYSTVKRRVLVKLVVDPDESYADTQSSLDNNEEIDTKIETQRVDSNNSKDVVLQTNMDSSSDNKVAEAKSMKQEKSLAKPVVSQSPTTKPKFIYHTVQPGDTLWNIAQRYQANVDQIKKANKISNSKYLRSGTRIKIPVKKG